MLKQPAKRISFLATGSELVCGETPESNCARFAKELHEMGGTIFQHLQAADSITEIKIAMEYLLLHSDALIITGGLGPTSDDLTRFALAEMTQSPLCFSTVAWTHILSRLKQFNIIEPNAGHRQQALFPAHATLYPNELGSAFGCHLNWQEKEIFMLPGPPREAIPLFDRYVPEWLKARGFFREYRRYQWKTTGLIEGEIAAEIDAAIQGYPIKSAYRWSPPYLMIKLDIDTDPPIDADIEALIQQLTARIAPYFVEN